MTFAAFETQPVTESGIEMPGAGGGFHKALEVDRLELHHGQRVTLVVEVEVAKVRFDPVEADEPDGELRRVHVLKVLNAARFDDAAAQERLSQQAAKIAAEKGELPFGDGEDDTEGAPGELCAHDLPPAECDDCVPLPIPDGPAPDSIPALDAQFDEGDGPGPGGRNGLHAVTG